MKVFYTNDFPGHYPVGTSAVVVADNPDRAYYLLFDELRSHGLRIDREDCTFIELKTTTERAIVLQDGNY